MKQHAIEKLKEYLLNHEEDIVMGINDMDDLFTVFESFIGRTPTLPPHEITLPVAISGMCIKIINTGNNTVRISGVGDLIPNATWTQPKT